MIDTDALISYLVVDKVIKDGEKRGANLSKNDKNISCYLPLISPENAGISTYLTIDKVQKKTQTSLENAKKWETYTYELGQLELETVEDEDGNKKKLSDLGNIVIKALKDRIKNISIDDLSTDLEKDAVSILKLVFMHYPSFYK
ncbi:MAG: hypothetical protein AAF806_12520 [Bacteroidota bacterium]